jgi:hypothetical protein
MTYSILLGPTHVIWVDKIHVGPSIQCGLVQVGLGPSIHYKHMGLFIPVEKKGLSIVYDVYLSIGPLIML